LDYELPEPKNNWEFSEKFYKELENDQIWNNFQEHLNSRLDEIERKKRQLEREEKEVKRVIQQSKDKNHFWELGKKIGIEENKKPELENKIELTTLGNK